MSIDFRARGWWRDETFLDDLRRASRATPDKPALVCYRDSEPETVSYAELAERVDRIAGNLHRLGARPGDVITLQLPNSWQLVALCLACSRMGAIPAPVVPIMRRREVQFMLRLTGSRMYIAADEFRGFDYAQLGAELADAVPTLRTRIVLSSSGRVVDGALDFDRALLDAAPADVDLDALEAKADDPAQLMFTSGTTGEPKGVLHSHNTLYWMNRAQADVLGLGSDEVTAMGSPTSHQAGYTWNFLMPLLLGATAIHVDVWDPRAMLEILERHEVTFFMGAPTFLQDLIEAQRSEPRDLGALAVFATGSAPIAPMLVEGALEVLGCRLYSLWGMTENGCVTITRPEDPVDRAAESDGSVIPGMQVRIVAASEDSADGAGALQVRGASQCLGYFKRDEVYRESLTEDGWFDTGDLARDDGHGGIRITGRVKDLIMRGGENVPAVEVEAALLRHPAVHDVAVVGYPDDRLGERACAVVVPDDGATLTLDDIRDHLEEAGMVKQYWPEQLTLTDALPRTPSGKVQRVLVRERLADAAEPLHAVRA